MAEPVSTTTGAIAVGAMLTTGGLIADLIIFNDGMYLWLAITGAIVSMLGVLHEILKHKPLEHTAWQIAGELLKGLILGILAIPFWYLVLSSAGELLVARIFGFKLPPMVDSVWLIASFYLSWFTVPMIDAVARGFKSMKNWKVSFNWKVENKDG